MGVKRRELLINAGSMAAILAGGELTSADMASAHRSHLPTRWQQEADIVVIGSGATGLPAAIVARESGASVIVIEAENHIGGHAITSGGNISLGGGTSVQKRYGINDSPDLLFRDLTDWSVVEPNGFPDYRYNDREIVRAFADNSARTFEWLIAQGVVFVDKAPESGGISVGNSVPRETHGAVLDWAMVQTGRPADPMLRGVLSSGEGLMRPLEPAARKAGVQILLEHKMTAILREAPPSGRTLGVAADNKGQAVNIRARKAVIIATGGSTGNVNFRRMFDPRLTEEYCGLAGMPWSNQDASGELAAMAIGASLWGLQPNRRIRIEHHQARHDRKPIRLCLSALDAGQPGVRSRARHRFAGRRLAGPDPCQHVGQALLRRNWWPVYGEQPQLHRGLRPRKLSQHQEH